MKENKINPSKEGMVTTIIHARKSCLGFTLMEMILVIVIMATLVVIVIPIYTSKTEVAKKTAHNTNVSTLENKAELYLLEQEVVLPQDNIIDDLLAKGYIQKMPTYPLGTEDYAVAVDANGKITVTPAAIPMPGDSLVTSLLITANTSPITNAASITYTFEFGENVTGFEVGDITVTNGSKGTFTAVDGNTYTLVVTNAGNITQIVSVAAGVCQTTLGGDNLSAEKQIVVDLNALTVNITANTPDTTNASSVIYTLEFSKSVIGFTASDITVTNGTKGIFTTVDGNTYTLVVTNTGSCAQTVSIAQGVCTDNAGNNNEVGSKTVTIDRTGPTVVITASTPDTTSVSSITYTFEFSANVIGFVVGDVGVTNGVKGTFTEVDGNTYTLVVTNSGACTQAVVVGNGVCIDVDGNGNAGGSKTVTITASFAANSPRFAPGLIPLIFDANNFRDATPQEILDKTWYNYREDIDQSAEDRVSNERWANVRLADGSMFVWIPRYTYKITGDDTTGTSADDKIQIIYSNGTTDDTQGGTYKVHPAFWWDNDNDGVHDAGEELKGIWVAKFEASNDGTVKVQVKPGVASWRARNISNTFSSCREMQTINSTKYGISSDSNVMDTHMMKNSEWGAVAYLTEAIRDGNQVWINNSSTYITGSAGSSVSAASNVGTTNDYKSAQGQNASTTGNVYGIYDLNGGAYEHVAGYISNGNVCLTVDGSNLISAVAKYKDELIGTFDGTEANAYTQTATQTDGMALHEISTDSGASVSTNPFNGYGDYQYFPYNATPFFRRGGMYNSGALSGVYAVYYGDGSVATVVGFRPVLSVLN